MSYDVKLFVVMPGAGTPEEQFDRLMNEAERTVRAPPLPPEDVKRIEAMKDALRELDAAAKFQDLRDGEHLKGFVVTDASSLPYVEIGAQDGALAWSMGAAPADLYRSLMRLTGLAARHGYHAFDHQQGAILKTSDDFATFMQQFANQWPSPEDFKRWFAAETGASTASAPPTSSAGKQPGFLAWIIVAVVVVWAAWKLHKAGYF